LIDWQLIAVGPPHLAVAELGLFGYDDVLAETDQDMLARHYLTKFAKDSGVSWSVEAFIDHCRLARLMSWAYHMKEMVEDLERSVDDGVSLQGRFRHRLQSCINDWLDVLDRPIR